jgi:ABC-2 type transport system permease protein
VAGLERAAVMRLLRAEFTRLLSRRLTGIALLIMLLGLGGYQLVVNDSLSPLTGEQLAAAQRTYQETHKDWVENHEEYEEDCRDSGGSPEECAIPEPTLKDFSVEPMPFHEAARTALLMSTVLASLVAFIVSASFIGAEYSSGSISNWLTFVPRRGSVFWSKLLSVTGFAGLLGALAAVVVLAAGLVLARLHGSPVTSLPELAEIAARSVLAAIGLAILGFCLGLVTRHTAGAMGILLAFVVVSVVRLGPLNSLPWAQRITPWTPEANMAAILQRGHKYYVPAEKVTAEGVDIEYVEHHLSLMHGATYWTILLLVLVVASLLIFRRRDVV